MNMRTLPNSFREDGRCWKRCSIVLTQLKRQTTPIQ